MSAKDNKPDLQDDYYAPGQAMKGYLRSLVIANGRSTKGKVHVRDAIDVKRTMTMVGLCLLPAILFGLYNLGLQAQIAVVSGLSTPNVWQLGLFNLISGGLTEQTGLIGLFLYGLSFYFPIYLTALLVSLFWEMVFAKVRGQELHEGFFVTALLFTLILPVSTPLWIVAMGITFGVVIAKELFGGMGYNFLNPALAGLSFIFFAYPTEVASVGQLVAVDGFSGATTLAQTAAGKISFVDYAWFDAFKDPNWWNSFLGFTPGAIGETSTLALLIGGGLLLLSRLADWRIVAGVMLGMVLTAIMFNLIGSTKNDLFAMPWTWHLVTGGFALGMMFMATDPVTTSYTRKGKVAYGLLIGFMTVLIRVINPKMPESIMLAILFANLWAPIFDYLVAQANIKRRLKRHAL
ncbi:NADH:ubiquinone reductase (Na(+)-transporting) subunit B [Shewanella sp. D64]|uniref:NADH:ubiquinone reductase (Na(+)-transporting) subunit B n=1 Tax=unclassified Shewanella TaxID=196818 RepID=UPI0022BA3FD2|nr:MULTISPECIES: NADH:ubiquinone reductase (Na(+)-transporting) subunit B [unclassified Shewanella]MEC4727677.1 NADH:ubiquinone reductase (Na(+)-transporting) subunit B [Shewanella sp. D64]MEC4739750.1 NADH:ubiquinone reductase (Na(+)-transporting) subunit B [Shewanella sp. E94]WBJ94073.1 NADH:ubiquinone reductase (Na(+)-transporting) subunit B [Shewanella sp. MTB7]